MAGWLPGGPLIASVPVRVLFAELLAGALSRTRVAATPLATGYLVDLLEERVRPEPASPASAAEPTLAEGLLRARCERGAAHLRRLRSLGDRALFVAGFFGDSLERGVVGIDYYRDAGRLAYAGVSRALRSRRDLGPSERGAAGVPAGVPQLFEELADRFADFAEVLTEVGDSTREQRPGGLLPLYTRYLRGGSERDRRRLARRGHSVPAGERAGREWQ
jgi:hypothetical protein